MICVYLKYRRKVSKDDRRISLTIDFGFQIDTFSVFNPFLAINFSYWYPRNTSCIGNFAAKLVFVCVKDGFVSYHFSRQF